MDTYKKKFGAHVHQVGDHNDGISSIDVFVDFALDKEDMKIDNVYREELRKKIQDLYECIFNKPVTVRMDDECDICEGIDYSHKPGCPHTIGDLGYQEA